MSETIVVTLISSSFILGGIIVKGIMDFKIKKLEQESKMRLEVLEQEAIVRAEELEKSQRETHEHRLKADVLEKVLDLTSFNIIMSGVEEIFDRTKADRFLILIAINGKVDFNIVSVIFEQHKDQKYKVNAIAKYKSLEIDSCYRDMLKESERYGVVHLDVKKMKDSLLKYIYQSENVKHSRIRHLIRKPIDEENHVLMYSSIATHLDEKFTAVENTIIKTVYEGTIIPQLKKTLK